MLRRWFVFVLASSAAVFAQASHPAAGYLGVSVQDIDSDEAKALHLPQEAGVKVTLLDPMGPAATAGIRLYDVIMLYNNQLVEGRFQLDRLIRETPPGREVRIQVFRNGYPQSLVAKIGANVHSAQPQRAPLSPAAMAAMPDAPLQRVGWRSVLGAEWEALDGQLAAYFGAKDGGVLVRSVTSGSVAESAGLHAGDVIIRVGDAHVGTPPDIAGRIRAGRASSATLTIIRDHKEMNLTIPLDGSRTGQ